MATSDVDSCSQCALLRLRIEKAENEHSARFLSLKKKIISTDLLITKYKAQSNELSSCRVKLDSAASRIKSVASELTDVESKLQAARTRVQHLTQANESLEKRCQKQSSELEHNKDVITYLEGSNKQLTVSCQNFEKQLEEQKSEVSTTKLQLKEAQKIKVSKEVTAALKEEVKALKTELKKQKQEHEKQLRELKQSLASPASVPVRARKSLPAKGKQSKPPSPDGDLLPPSRDVPPALLPVEGDAVTGSLTDSEQDSIGSDVDIPFSSSKTSVAATQEKRRESISSFAPSSSSAAGATLLGANELPATGIRRSRRLSVQGSKDEFKGHHKAADSKVVQPASKPEHQKSAFRRPAEIDRRTLSTSSTDGEEDVDTVLSTMTMSLRPRLISPLRPSPLPRDMTARTGSQLESQTSPLPTTSRRIDLTVGTERPAADEQPAEQDVPSAFQPMEVPQDSLAEISSSSDDGATNLSHNAPATSQFTTAPTPTSHANCGGDEVLSDVQMVSADSASSSNASETPRVVSSADSNPQKTVVPVGMEVDDKVLDQSRNNLQPALSTASNQTAAVMSHVADATKTKEVATKVKSLPIVKKIIRRAAPSLPNLDLLSRKYPMRDSQVDMKEETVASEGQRDEPSAPTTSVDGLSLESSSSGRKRIARVTSSVPDLSTRKTSVGAEDSKSQVVSGDENLPLSTLVQKPAMEKKTKAAKKRRGKKLSKQRMANADKDDLVSTEPSCVAEQGEGADSVADKMAVPCQAPDQSTHVEDKSAGDSAEHSVDLSAEKVSPSKHRKGKIGSHQSRLEWTRQRSAMKAQLIEERQKVTEESLRTTVAVQQVADGWDAALKKRSTKQKPTVESTVSTSPPQAKMAPAENVGNCDDASNTPSVSLTDNVITGDNRNNQTLALSKSDNDEQRKGEGHLSPKRSPHFRITTEHIEDKIKSLDEHSREGFTPLAVDESNSETVKYATEGETQQNHVPLTSSPRQPVKAKVESAVGLRRSLRKRGASETSDQQPKRARTLSATRLSKQSTQAGKLSTIVPSEGSMAPSAKKGAEVGTDSTSPQFETGEGVQTRLAPSEVQEMSDSNLDTGGRLTLNSKVDHKDSIVSLQQSQAVTDTHALGGMLEGVVEKTTPAAPDAQSQLVEDSTRTRSPTDITSRTAHTPAVSSSTTPDAAGLQNKSAGLLVVDPASVSIPGFWTAEKISSDGRQLSIDTCTNSHLASASTHPNSVTPLSSGEKTQSKLASSSVPSSDQLTPNKTISPVQISPDVCALPVHPSCVPASDTRASIIAPVPCDTQTRTGDPSSSGEPASHEVSTVTALPDVSGASGTSSSPGIPLSLSSLSSPNGPSSPGAPMSPASPGAPMSPDSPASPGAPMSPDGPACPDAPMSPDGPTCPDAPMSPDGPASPVAPMSPDVPPGAPMSPDVPPGAPMSPDGPACTGAPMSPDGPASPGVPISPVSTGAPMPPTSPGAPMSPDGPASPNAPMSPVGPASPGAPDSPPGSPMQSDSELVIVEEPAIIPTSPGGGVEYDNTDVGVTHSWPAAISVYAFGDDLSTTVGPHQLSAVTTAPPAAEISASPALVPSYVPQRSRQLPLYGGISTDRHAADHETAVNSVTGLSTSPPVRRSARILQRILSPPAALEGCGYSTGDELPANAEEISGEVLSKEETITLMGIRENVVMNNEKTTADVSAKSNDSEKCESFGKSKAGITSASTSVVVGKESHLVASREPQLEGIDVSSAAVTALACESRETSNKNLPHGSQEKTNVCDATVPDCIQQSGNDNSNSASNALLSNAKPAGEKNHSQAAVRERLPGKQNNSHDSKASALGRQLSVNDANLPVSKVADSTCGTPGSHLPGTPGWMYSILELSPLFPAEISRGMVSPIKLNEDIKVEKVKKSKAPAMPLDMIKLTSPPKLPAPSHSAKIASMLAKEMATRSMFAAGPPTAGKTPTGKVCKRKTFKKKPGGNSQKKARGKAKKDKTYGLPANPIYGQGFWDPDALAAGTEAGSAKPRAAQDAMTGSRPLLSYEDDCLFDEPAQISNKKRRKMQRLARRQAQREAEKHAQTTAVESSASKPAAVVSKVTSS